MMTRSKALTACIASVFAAIALCGAPAQSLAAQQSVSAASIETVTDWSNKVWEAAKESRGSQVRELLFNPPKLQDGDALLSGYTSHSEQAKTNLSTWRDKREHRFTELRDELDTHIESKEFEEALQSANELMELAEDRETFLTGADISSLTEKAERAAAQAETDEDWLESLELYNWLNLLYDVERRYEKDVERAAQRLTMLRMYAPEKLHEMQNKRQQAKGKDPLGEYNAFGDSWQEKVGDITISMVADAIRRASDNHVESVGMRSILLRGYENVRTFAETPDLSAVFPKLTDRASVSEFTDYVDTRMKMVEDGDVRMNVHSLLVTLRSLVNVADDTIGVREEVILHEFGVGAMSALDQYSTIIWPHELRRFRRSLEGEFKGVGIQITLDDARKIKVVAPLHGTPAAQAGIRSGDRIVEVDGESTIGISLNQAVDRITGQKGTSVTLGIERSGHDELLRFELERDIIPLHSVKGWERTGTDSDDWDWFVDDQNGVGYIRLTQFTTSTTTDLHNAIDSMQEDGLNALILDLRWNPGGLLDQAVGVANTFLDRNATVVTQEDSSGQRTASQETQDFRAVLPDTPLVILINEGSASASEIVAGCLQDYDRAIVLGERSYGKGSVQNVFPLAGQKAMLKLTEQYYRLPGGRRIHRAPNRTDFGIKPDVVVDMLPEQMQQTLELRMDADVIAVDENGDPLPEEADSPKPQKLLAEGLDPQLETALLLLQSKVAIDRTVKDIRAAMR